MEGVQEVEERRPSPQQLEVEVEGVQEVEEQRSSPQQLEVGEVEGVQEVEERRSSRQRLAEGGQHLQGPQWQETGGQGAAAGQKCRPWSIQVREGEGAVQEEEEEPAMASQRLQIGARRLYCHNHDRMEEGTPSLLGGRRKRAQHPSDLPSDGHHPRAPRGMDSALRTSAPMRAAVPRSDASAAIEVSRRPCCRCLWRKMKPTASGTRESMQGGALSQTSGWGRRLSCLKAESAAWAWTGR